MQKRDGKQKNGPSAESDNISYSSISKCCNNNDSQVTRKVTQAVSKTNNINLAIFLIWQKFI